MQKVLLVDLDSKIPNLVLMKLSAWHQRKGDNVSFNWYFGEYDKVYVSCIFSQNKTLIKRLPFNNMVLGGSGTENYSLTLPSEIEHTKPDYRLYHADFSLGFSSRGCIRKCPWCIVPEKEGEIKDWAEIYEFWDRKHQKIVLLDNNLLAAPNWKNTLLNLAKEALWVDFNQGLDIRLINEENAYLLSKIKTKQLRFAFDDVRYEKSLRRGIKTLDKYGLRKQKLSFYVLTNFNSTLNEDHYRVSLLDGFGVNLFVMVYGKADRVHREFQRWANLPRFRKTKSFKEWLRLRGVKRTMQKSFSSSAREAMSERRGT